MLARPAVPLLVALGLAWALPAGAGPLDADASQLHFVSIKQDHLAETHRFRRLDGHLYPSGRAEVTIDLASVATGIRVRDRRMRDKLFAVEHHPRAHLTTQVDLEALKGLAPGESARREIRSELRLHGRTQPVRAKVTVARRADGGFRVSSRAPVVLNARDFGLAPGVAILRRLAGLDRISYAVPVTFTLAFAGPR
jgi:polyisoprenoid-binding protein YceI